MHVSRVESGAVRRTQAERRATSRAALLEAAAKGFSRYGYGNVVLESIAREAGYTRGALYHLFNGKEQLALAVVEWVSQTWQQEVWERAESRTAPTDVLIALARGHVVFCRRDVARVMMALRVEFSGRDHPVGRVVAEIGRDLAERFSALIIAGRRSGEIPPGPPARTLAVAAISAMEGLAIELAGDRHDGVVAERMIRGILGLEPV
jgi:AcrR family transcriptional regulator